MTVNVNPSPMAANVTWPDNEHVALARHAIKNPFLVIPHPKNANHPLCVKCSIFAASTLVVQAQDPYQSGLRERECSLPSTADRAQRPTSIMNTFTRWHNADAELHGIVKGTSAFNATKKKKGRETVTWRDAKRRDLVTGHTAKDNMDCFCQCWIVSVNATHTRAESVEGKGETMVGAKEIALSKKANRCTQEKHAETAAD